MWLVKRSDPKPGAHATELPPHERAALHKAYKGNASRRESQQAIDLVKKARMFDMWIACDCRQGEGVFPLLTPAYLTDRRRYYIRRMTSQDRAEHDDHCLFRFDRPEPGLNPIETDNKTSGYPEKPTGLFSVLNKEKASTLSAKSDQPKEQRDVSGKPEPALAGQLRRLMDDAGVNVLQPLQMSLEPSIQNEFKALKQAARKLTATKGVSLFDVMATHPSDYHSKRLYARIREAYTKADDPKAPKQGFLLTYTKWIKGRELGFDKIEPIMVAGSLSKPVIGDNDRRAPFLSLVVFGEHKSANGLAPLRGYAQPIYSGRQFAPVEFHFERQTLVMINRCRWSLSKSHAHLSLKVIKPLFAIKRDNEKCLPDFVIEVMNTKTGQLAELVIEAMGYDNEAYDEAKRRTHSIMEKIGPVITVTPAELGDKDQIDRKIVSALHESVRP